MNRWLEHLYDFTRNEIDEHSSRITQVAEALPGDRRFEFDFVAVDGTEEQQVTHNLGYEPRNMVIISQSAPGSVYASRDKLGDTNAIYIKSSFRAGERIRVRIY